jgi:hypothetical protein
MGTELVAYRYDTNYAADERNAAAYWAFAYVGWVTFFERYPRTNPVKYPNTSQEAIDKQAALSFREYKRCLEWAKRWEERGV